MKKFFFISFIFIFIAACGTPSSTQPVPTATQAPTNTPAPTATQTQTPTPTNTPTPTITPFPKVPEEASEFFKNIDWSDFVLVSHEERLELNDRFMNDPSQWKLPTDPNSIPRPIILGTNVSTEGTSVYLDCLLSINCAPHYVVVEKVSEGLLYIIIWELITKGSDDKNVRVSFSTAFTTDSIYTDWQLNQIRAIGSYSPKAELGLNIVINDPNHIETELTRTLLVDDPARQAFTKGIIDEQTADILFWTTLISSVPGQY